MKKIAVIGGGIFGCSAALELSRDNEVVIFEKSDGILNGATTHNHLRHHYGYHYPRSKETALESIKGRESFEREYGECVIKGFPAYYAIAKKGSKSTAEEFLKFCDNLDLKYEEVEPDPEIFDVSKIVKCLKTDEPAYDPNVLKEIVAKKLGESGIDARFGHEIIGGEILKNGKKKLKIKNEENDFDEDFDIVISAIYSNFNKINKWFGFPKKKVEYALMELLDIELPIKERIAAMIVDGDFSTFVPLKEKCVYRLGHVKKSVLKEGVSDHLDGDLIASENTDSNKDKILEESARYYPIIKNAKFLRSIFITRVVKANVEDTDERPTEITAHGNGVYSIFGGKIITCVNTAKELAGMIDKTFIHG
jgi:hypothetical protein